MGYGPCILRLPQPPAHLVGRVVHVREGDGSYREGVVEKVAPCHAVVRFSRVECRQASVVTVREAHVRLVTWPRIGEVCHPPTECKRWHPGDPGACVPLGDEEEGEA